MRRCLIVANQTLDSPALAQAVAERVKAEEHTFFVVVPATPLKYQTASFPGASQLGSSPEERSFAVATQRLDRALEQIRGSGATADGEVGDPDEYESAQKAIRAFGPQEVLVSTLPPRLSRWLRQDLPGKIDRAFHLPVTVIGESTDKP